MDVEEYLRCKRNVLGLPISSSALWNPTGIEGTRKPCGNIYQKKSRISSDPPENSRSLFAGIIDQLTSLENITGLVIADEHGGLMRSIQVRENARMRTEDIRSFEFRSRDHFRMHSIHNMCHQDRLSSVSRLMLTQISLEATREMSHEDGVARMTRREMGERTAMTLECLISRRTVIMARKEHYNLCVEDVSSRLMRVYILSERRDLVVIDVWSRFNHRVRSHAATTVQSSWRCFIVRRWYKKVSDAVKIIQAIWRRKRNINQWLKSLPGLVVIEESIEKQSSADVPNDNLAELLLLDREYIRNCDSVLEASYELNDDVHLFVFDDFPAEKTVIDPTKYTVHLVNDDRCHVPEDVPEVHEEMEGVSSFEKLYIRGRMGARRRRTHLIRRTSAWH